MHKAILSALLVGLTACSGCGGLAPYAPDTGRHDMWDAAFRRRHKDHKGLVAADPMLRVARDLTVLEDDIRRDGSITVKEPDVWGDANLVAMIQEYEKNMSLQDGATIEKRFSETLSAYIARSDQAELQSTTALAQGLSGGTKPSTTIEALNINTPDLLSQLTGKFPLKKSDGIGLEPTELERQRSTFIGVNQALRRRMLGDDNSRAAGYGLYLFRIPISVLPGRETTDGYSAVATLRARLVVDQAHLKYTFPKLVIADLADSFTPIVLDRLRNNVVSGHCAAVDATTSDAPAPQPEAPSAPSPEPAAREEVPVPLVPPQPRPDESSEGAASRSHFDQQFVSYPSEKREVKDWNTQPSPGQVATEQLEQLFGKSSIDALSDRVKNHFDALKAQRDLIKHQDVKDVLFKIFEQAHNAMLEMRLYEEQVGLIDCAGRDFMAGRFGQVAHHRESWNCLFVGTPLHADIAKMTWLLALQTAICDRNIKKIVEELQIKGKLSNEEGAAGQEVHFFISDNPEAVRIWKVVVEEAFPLHVFAIDPQVEEQNASDAFSRRREMQLALAYSVAKGTSFTADQKLKFSRALALDQAAIALNRTAVGFNHGPDTFGWYFHPRIQSPPVESTNLGAFARTLWSTGPTDHYDRKHRRLDPGIRECEVLVAMPAFVTEVSFDVTTNWEKIATPGVTKRSYEEMIAQGGRVQQLRMCMRDPRNQHCYRPGDYERLLSRIDQLEHMLGMQTYTVNTPYQYEQTGTDLFDTGNKQQRPELSAFYGLTFLEPIAPTAPTKVDADMFLTGRNFHPTLTHVIIGGTEIDSASTTEGKLEVVSRELLRVRVANINAKLSPAGNYEIRVATPAGISNPLVITMQPKPSGATANYDLKKAELTGSLCAVCDDLGRTSAGLSMDTVPENVEIEKKSMSYPDVGTAVLTMKIGKKDYETEAVPVNDLKIDRIAMNRELAKLFAGVVPATTAEAAQTFTFSVRFTPVKIGSTFPTENLATPLVVKVSPRTLPECKECRTVASITPLPAPDRQGVSRLPAIHLEGNATDNDRR